MRALIILLIGLLSFESMAQHRPTKPKYSTGSGTLFGYVGYNRSTYSQSNLHFIGPGYDFTLKDVIARDVYEPQEGLVYYNKEKITSPQFNARIGYYFRNHYAISLGFDQMKYILADNNEAFLSGDIDPSVGDTLWSGVYNGEKISTNRNHFHYENSGGLNYLRLELTRSDRWFNTGSRGQFAFSTSVGIGLGAIISVNDFKFAGRKDEGISSMSGYGLSLHLGPRFEFFKHFFIQPNLSGGLMHQLKVRTRSNEPETYARHAYGYLSFETLVGFFIYIRPENACNTCPQW